VHERNDGHRRIKGNANDSGQMQDHEDWRATSTGIYLDGRIKSLIIDMVNPGPAKESSTSDAAAAIISLFSEKKGAT